VLLLAGAAGRSEAAVAGAYAEDERDLAETTARC